MIVLELPRNCVYEELFVDVPIPKISLTLNSDEEKTYRGRGTRPILNEYTKNCVSTNGRRSCSYDNA